MNKGETSGAASTSVIRRMVTTPKFITSWDYIRHKMVIQNMDLFLWPYFDKDTPSIYHYMVNDVACEERHVPGADMIMRGYGRESNFDGVSLRVKSIESLEALREAEERGQLKLAKDITVFVCGRNSKTGYSLSVVAASGR